MSNITELELTNLIKRFLNDESGATAIEYGLIAALVSVALIAGATALGGQIGATFNKLETELKTATGK